MNVKLAKLEATGGSLYGQGPQGVAYDANGLIGLAASMKTGCKYKNESGDHLRNWSMGRDGHGFFKVTAGGHTPRIFFNILLIAASHHSKRPIPLFPSKRVLLGGRLCSLTYIPHFEPSREPDPLQSSMSVWRLAVGSKPFCTVCRVATTGGTTSENTALPALSREELSSMTHFHTRCNVFPRSFIKLSRKCKISNGICF